MTFVGVLFVLVHQKFLYGLQPEGAVLIVLIVFAALVVPLEYTLVLLDPKPSKGFPTSRPDRSLLPLSMLTYNCRLSLIVLIVVGADFTCCLLVNSQLTVMCDNVHIS